MKIFTKNDQGFTLIELLVVIAIIGLLSAIVVTSVNSARAKANDVAIKSAVDQSRTIAALIYDRDGTATGYSNLCATQTTFTVGDANYGTQLTQIAASITNNGGSLTNCYDSAAAFCVQASLKGGGSFCVDHKGNAGSTNVTCAAANVECD